MQPQINKLKRGRKFLRIKKGSPKKEWYKDVGEKKVNVKKERLFYLVLPSDAMAKETTTLSFGI